ncbi:hypothetical protein [Microbacterium sp. No. 7]|uniref:hypothetical protein n=1 Tax=Microbacterium sp. No. 7 TaxID=1714373 RepID=UPI0006D26383|nr:hypothetical protein [Microbacterium sp. No. 7]ALJ22071.1 hypothetical protein AOA12_20130 [Microbacterium sp. No. 7]
MTDQEIRVGQVWRRKRNGRLIRITRQNTHAGKPVDDWRWNGVDYTGDGWCWGSNIRRDCELVEDVK